MKSIPANPTGDVRRLSLAVREHVHWALANCDAILIAVSGGADSTALAAVVIDHCLRAGSTPHTLSVDHGIRPGSDREAQETCKVMASLRAQSSWVSVTVDAPGGPEASARVARRSALAEHAQTLGERVAVFLGHTMDDQAETVLLRLARGSGVGSLRAMSVRDDAGSIVWMRPLMNCRRSETLGACRQLELPWVDDPSNKMDGPWRAADGSALRRSAVREQAIPSLAHSLGMDPVPSLARTAELSAADDDALNEWAEQVWQRAWECAAGETRSGSEALVAELQPTSEVRTARTRRWGSRPRKLGYFGSQNSKKSPKRCACAFFTAISAQWEHPPWLTSNKPMRSSLAGAGKALSRFPKEPSRASEKQKTRCSSCTHCA